MVKLSATGAVLSPANGFIGGGLSVPSSLAIDNGGNVWVINSQTGYPNAGSWLSKLSPTGAPSPAPASRPARKSLIGPQSIAVDSTGSVWVSNGLDYTVTQFIGAATAVVTPVAANLQRPYSNPASRP